MAQPGQGLVEKVALVTGASSGIGLATAQLFAANGASVVLADVDELVGSSAAADIRDAGGRAIFVRVDVRSQDDVDAAVASAEAQFGRFDIMIANAGTVGGNAVGRRMEDLDESQWLSIVDVNLNGVFRSFKSAIRSMRRQGNGGVLSATSSVAALGGVAGQAAYSAAKGGVASLVRSLAFQLAADRIRVNCVCPGGVSTNLLASTDIGESRRATRLEAAGTPEVAALRSMAQTGAADPRLLMYPMAEAGDVAAAHLFLASEASRFVNGHALVVDGGSLAAHSWIVVDR